MVFKLVMEASNSWRRLQGQKLLPKLMCGVKFRDVIEIALDQKSAATLLVKKLLQQSLSRIGNTATSSLARRSRYFYF